MNAESGRLDPRQLAANELLYTSQTLLIFVAAVAAVPGFVLALFEANRRCRNPLVWGPAAALMSAVAYMAGGRIAPTISDSPAAEVFTPLSLALVAGLVPGLFVARFRTMSVQRRWRAMRILEGWSAAREVTLSLARDGLMVKDGDDELVIPRERLRAFDRSSTTLLIRFTRSDGEPEVLRLVAIPADGEDEVILAEAIHARVTSVLGPTRNARD
jgi:hypothetical protein